MLCIFVNTFAQNNTCPLYQKYINKGDTELAKGDKANFNEALKQYSNAMLHCPGKAKETREKIDKVYEKINQLNKNLERSKKEAERQRDRAKQQAQLAESEKQKAIAAKLEVESAKNHAEKEALLNKQISDAFLFYESNPTLALNNAQKILKESKSNPSGLQLTNFLLSRWPSPFYQNSFEEFPEYLESTSISPDGTIIATGGWDNRITLFDKSGTVKNVLMGHNDVIRDIKFSPDGKHILSGSNDNTAILWDREGNLIHHFKGHDGDVSCVAFSNNNKFILTGSWDHTSRLWSIDGNLIKIFEGKSRFEDLLFTPNDTGFISAGWDNEVIWWNTDGSIHKKFVHPSENIECLQLDKTGQYLLTGSWDNEIRLWDIHNNKIIEKFIGHTDKITSVLFWSDKYIISAGWDNTIRIWNINGNEIQKLVGHNHYVSNIALSKNKETIISSSWDKSIKTWHLPGLLISKFEQHEELPFAIAHSPVCNDFVSGDIKGNMFLWQNGKIPLRLKGHKDEINNIVYSHDGKFMLSSGRDNYAILWSKDGEKICSANPSDSDIKGIAFMKNKNNFVVGDRKGNVTIWDFNGTKKNSFITNEKFNTKINGYVLSPNNKQLLVYYENYLCIVYNLNGDEVLTYKGHKRQQGGRGIHKASFSPQGDAIVSTDDNNLIYMWDITGRDIATLKGHLSNVTNVCYSFDGSLFLTVSNDNSVKIWDKKGVNLQTIIPDNFKPTSACFTPDNKAVLINCYDNIIRKYYLIDSYLNSGKSYNGPTILNDEVIKK